MSGLYIDTRPLGLPDIPMWEIEDRERQYDTLYQVEIRNVVMQRGESRDYSYPVLIERDNLETR